MHKHKQYGFTIVELLIVIVVIAILAAISIVAYNGIQQRAKNTQTISGANAYYKALLLYKTDTGAFPVINGCLGANYPNGVCWMSGTNNDLTINTTLDTQLSPYISTKPTLATSLMDMYSPYKRAGMSYIYNSPTNIDVRYYLSGNNQSCSIAGFSAVNEGVLTNCSIVLTNQ